MFYNNPHCISVKFGGLLGLHFPLGSVTPDTYLITDNIAMHSAFGESHKVCMD